MAAMNRNPDVLWLIILELVKKPSPCALYLFLRVLLVYEITRVAFQRFFLFQN
jgi:hypothetical protein